ncbi:MAG: hypothetical protein ACK2TX_07275, partial [Anaerolineales bacterium]
MKQSSGKGSRNLRFLKFLWRREMIAPERVRAWFLIDADPEHLSDVREMLRGLDDKENDTIVVVRIDEVGGGCFNLVAPVDASSQERLNYIDTNLRNDVRVKTHRVLQVVKHESQDQGLPPHLAEGYISPAEF